MAIVDRVPGFLVNPQHGLLLRFLINPTPLQIRKATQYNTEGIPGWEGPIRWWTGGGDKTISFELFFDSSEAIRTTGVQVKLPGVGIRPDLETLESFLYPRVAPFGPSNAGNEIAQTSMSRIKQTVDNFFKVPSEWVAPPDAFLIYGTRWWRGKITAAPVTETKHDAILNPTQATSQITMAVDEFGTLHRLMTTQRQFFAMLGSVESGLTTILPSNIGEVVTAFGNTFSR
jgi:hypothetical protein